VRRRTAASGEVAGGPSGALAYGPAAQPAGRCPALRLPPVPARPTARV